MTFTPTGSLNPHGAPVLRSGIITNSITVTINCSVKSASGFIALGTAGNMVFGHVTAITTAKDVGLLTTGVAGSQIGSFVNSYLTASNNQTVGLVAAKCDISKFSLYSATENATIGTTTGSNLMGYNQDLADSVTLNESSATQNASAATTAGQYFGWGVDPLNTANCLVLIYESQIFGI